MVDTTNAVESMQAWALSRENAAVAITVAKPSEYLERLHLRGTEVLPLTAPRTAAEANQWLAAAAQKLVSVSERLADVNRQVFERDVLIRKLSAIDTDKAELAELGKFKTDVVDALRAAGFEYPGWVEHFDERVGHVVRDTLTTQFTMMMALEEHPAELAATATKTAYDASLALLEAVHASGGSLADALQQLAELRRVETMSPLERSGLLTEAGKALLASR